MQSSADKQQTWLAQGTISTNPGSELRSWLLAPILALILISGWMALTTGRIEPLRRNIVYIHVPAAISALVCFAVLFVCSVQYLIIKREKWDHIAAASAEAGLVFATALNVTGMIFARAEWGQWWTASPRLISSAVLWFLYVAYLILRASLTSEQQRAKISAVFGIIAFIDVPLVLISARFVRDIHQPNAGFQTGWQYAALGLTVCGMLLLAWLMIWIRADILKTDSELSNID